MDFGLTGLIPRFFKRLASHRSKPFSACFMPHVRGQEHSWRSAVVDCILIETGKNVGVATRFNCKDFSRNRSNPPTPCQLTGGCATHPQRPTRSLLPAASDAHPRLSGQSIPIAIAAPQRLRRESKGRRSFRQVGTIFTLGRLLSGGMITFGG
jgi:hypothetical protein